MKARHPAMLCVLRLGAAGAACGGTAETSSSTARLTDDLKNWTDHGECFNARTGSTWARYSRAPLVVFRNNEL